MEKIVLLGGGGHCKSIIDSIKSRNEYDIYGVLDPELKVNTEIYDNVYVMGNDDDLEEIYKRGIKNAFISVGSIGNTAIRRKLYEKAKKLGFNFPIICDNKAIIARSVVIDEGSFIGKGTIINSDVRIGKNSIINTGSIIEHDCVIHEFVHIAPGAVVCGGVNIGKDTHVGSNASIIQCLNIGEKVVIGSGSVVIRDVLDDKRVVGNPAREVKK